MFTVHVCVLCVCEYVHLCVCMCVQLLCMHQEGTQGSLLTSRLTCRFESTSACILVKLHSPCFYTPKPKRTAGPRCMCSLHNWQRCRENQNPAYGLLTMLHQLKHQQSVVFKNRDSSLTPGAKFTGLMLACPHPIRIKLEGTQ